MDQVNDVKIRCGGLAQTPRPPLDYKLVFSVRGLTNEYFGKAWIIRNHRREEISTFTELENIDFASPVGACEAFVTTGGSSTAPWTYEGKVKNYDYKTVRYKGHYDKIKLLIDLGYLDLNPVSINTTSGERVQIAPRELFHELIPSKISFPEDKDLVVLRMTAEGSKNGSPIRLQYDLLDFHCDETGFTAMERSTAYPAAQVLIHGAQGLAKKGVRALEAALDNRSYLEDLQKSDLKITGLGF